jgi:hypothetical protein
MYRLILVLLGVVAAGAAAAILLPTAGATQDPQQSVKAVTAHYNSVAQAIADGYSGVGEPCVASPLGTMGYHYANAALMADDALDPARPEILVYAPKPNGTLELVAIEYWKRDADGSLMTSGDRPSLFGQPFDGPMPGHNPTMPVHYDLHVWLYEDNPSGRFAQFNPAVSCTP